MNRFFRQTLLATAIATIATPALAATFSDPGTDYSKAQTQTWTWTPGLEPMQTANQILCFINNLKAGDMVNKGIYAALVDMNACQAGQSNGSSKGPNNMFAVVKSTRADSSSPEEVDVWVPDMSQGGGGDAQIHAHAEVTASPTSTNPSGQFKMTYKMYPITNGVVGSTIQEEGQLKSLPNSNGKIDLSFYSSGTDQGHSVINAVSVVKAPDGSSGAAITQGVDYQNSFAPVDYKFAWDNTTASGMVNIQKNSTTNICLNKNDVTQNVYQYGLYDASTGAKAKINGGFPFEYSRQDGSTGNGYLGYWGVWMDNNGGVTDGMTVQKVDYTTQPPTKTAITLHKSLGQLQKITTVVKTPSDVALIKFDYWDPSDGNQYQVKYLTAAPSSTTGFSNNGFYEVASETMSSNGSMTATALSTIKAVAPQYGSTVYLSAQQLNGNVVVHYTSGTPDSVVIQKQETETPDKISSTLTLYCNYNCPIGGLTATDITNNTAYYSGQGPYTYTFNPSTMLLTDSSNGKTVSWPSSASASGQYQNGIQSGALFTQSGATVGSAQGWYNYSTGPNNWNQTTWATGSSGTVITIDPPVNLSFTFTSGDDRNASSSNSGSSYYNNPFLLQFPGDGSIQGLPYTQSNGHYMPAISLKDGTQLTDANNSSKVYVVKALQQENDINSGNNCSGLTLPTNGTGGISLPTSVPAADLSTIQPIPSSYPQEPSVINGVIQ